VAAVLRRLRSCAIDQLTHGLVERLDHSEGCCHRQVTAMVIRAVAAPITEVAPS
jgi:hypothetical protein